MKHGIPEVSFEKLLDTIASEPSVQGIVLYGSRAKGSFRNGSDIDFCLDAPELDYLSLMRLENEVDDLLPPLESRYRGQAAHRQPGASGAYRTGGADDLRAGGMKA